MIYKTLSYVDYCQYYALKCEICKGEKRVLHSGIWTSCVCQHTATVKWHLEQFDVSPPDLKYKSWDDFVGTDGTTRLTDASFISAKQKALQYCFGSSDPDVIKDRRKNLIVHRHCQDGQNVIITGEAGTGKTLIAVLIIKEVAYACRTHNLKLNFKCIKSPFLQDAARWDSDKNLDHQLLDDLAEVNFLVLDEVEEYREGGHKTSPPDIIALNVLFGIRQMNSLPTIVICTGRFWAEVNHPRYHEAVSRRWGREFVSLMSNPRNAIIELEKDKKTNGI